MDGFFFISVTTSDPGKLYVFMLYFVNIEISVWIKSVSVTGVKMNSLLKLHVMWIISSIPVPVNMVPTYISPNLIAVILTLCMRSRDHYTRNYQFNVFEATS